MLEVCCAIVEPPSATRCAAFRKNWFCSGVPTVTRMQFGAPHGPSGRTLTPSFCSRRATDAAFSPKSQYRKFAQVGTTRHPSFDSPWVSTWACAALFSTTLSTYSW